MVASALSNLADGVFKIALPIVALGVTRDPASFGAVTVVGRLPWLLMALPAGALADRLDRRRTMIRVDAGRAVLIAMLAMLVAGEYRELWVLYVVAFALGVGETLFDTAAQSIVPAVVDDPRQLDRANGRLYAVEMIANQFIGPPIGGLIIVAASAALALGGSAAAYLAAALVLITLSGTFRPARTAEPTGLAADIVEGLRYLFRHHVLRTLALCVGVSNLAFTAVEAVLALYVVKPGPMGLTPSGLALLLACFAAGSVAASPLVDRIRRRLGTARALLVALSIFPAFPLVLALTDNVAAAVVVFPLVGSANVVWNVTTVSLRQRIVPDHLLGRINAGYRLMAWGTMPLGAALGAVIGARLGLPAVFWIAAGLSLTCLPLLLSGVSDRAILASQPRENDGNSAIAGEAT